MSGNQVKLLAKRAKEINVNVLVGELQDSVKRGMSFNFIYNNLELLRK
jgi:hypothetical protein